MPPYTLTDYDWGLHYWVDANVATPSEEPADAIVDGTPKTEATVIECKSFTGSSKLRLDRYDCSRSSFIHTGDAPHPTTIEHTDRHALGR